MSSISQFFENKSEIIIKNITKKVFCNHINEFTNIILYAPTEYKSIILNAKIKQLIPEIYEQSIVEMDELFFKSEYRKLYYYSSSTRERTYVTIFGELHFKRRYYVDKNKKNGFYLIDEILKLEKYKTYDSTVRGVLIQQSIITNPNQSAENYDVNLMNLQEFISDTSKTPKVPRQTIYEWIRDWNIPKVEYECFEKCKKLYVMVDEKWIHEQIRLLTLTEEEREKHHFIMSKCFVTFTGALTKNKRKELLNRHIFMTTEDKPWKLFMEEIYNIYNFEEIEEIYLLSDAGNWILAGKNELKLFKIIKLS